jgi:hypothetical protein
MGKVPSDLDKFVSENHHQLIIIQVPPTNTITPKTQLPNGYLDALIKYCSQHDIAFQELSERK